MKRLWILVVLGLTGFGALFIALVARERQIAADRSSAAQWQYDTQTVLLTAERTLTALLSAETGQRGFIITNDTSYLEPYLAAKQQLGEMLDQLASQTGDNPELSDRIAHLRELAGAKLDEWEETIALARSGDHALAVALVLTDRGKILMNGARGVVREIVQAENQILAERNLALEHAAASHETRIWELIAASFLLLLYCLGIALYARRLAEQKTVRADLAKFFQAIEQSPMSVLITDRNGTIEYTNPEFSTVTGYTQAEVIGRNLRSEHMAPEHDADLWKAISAGDVWRGELLTRKKNGELFWELACIAPVKDKGKIRNFIAVKQDITERRRSEQALRQSEQRFRALVTASSEVVYRMSPDWSEMRHLVGRDFITDTETTSRGWLETYIYPEDQPRVLAAINEAIEKRTSFELEHRVRRVDGSLGWTFSRAVPLFDAHGEVIEWFGAASDITERRRAEEQLQESEERLRRTVEQAPFPIMVHADDGEVVHLSQSWLALTGYDRADVSTISDWTERAYGQCGGAVRAEIERLFAIQGLVDEGEYAVRTADGTVRVWLFSSAPIGRDRRGRRLVVSMAIDITTRKETERALKESEARMRALLDASVLILKFLFTLGL